MADATVKCWGQNQAGQLGNETTVNAAAPVSAVHLPCGGKGTSNTCSGCVPTTCQAQKVSSGSIADGCGGTLLCGVDQPKLAAGNGFSCGLVGDGSARCWGVNDKGQLGDETLRTRYQPTSVDGAALPVAGVSGAVAVVAGDAHACALLGTGKVRCWGSHGNGQLGLGSAADSAPHFAAAEVVGISTAVAISAGALHTCAVLASGAVQCWGLNSSGQLGDGTNIQRIAPANVEGLSGIIAVRAGLNFTCALTQGGLVKCWGANSNGQLGNGTTASLVPRNVAGVSAVTELTAAALGQFAAVVLADGTAQAWGLNTYGQLGDGTTTFRPQAVGVMGLKAATSIRAGAYHACARLGDGSVKCWGYNYYGQLGDTTTTNRTLPVAAAEVSSATQLATGNNHTCAALQDGSLKCWGQNGFGQLGNETSINASSAAAVANFPCGGGGTSVVCGCTPTTCQAQKASSGSIADGCGGTLLCGSGAATVAGGNGFGCAIDGSGGVKCWGSNGSGQLGDGTTSSSTKPVAVKGVVGAVQVAAGESHACALVNSGAVWCWGYNLYGQLGLGTPGDFAPHAPGAVPGLTNAIKISAGRLHTCAVIADGTARCWGYNNSGQLGDGTTLQRTAPVAVVELSGLVDIASAYSTTCALKQTGLVKCWGSNGSGQAGNGNASAVTPMNVAGLTQATALASGPNAQHACALVSGGAVRCWGTNSNGQLGDNSTIARNLPISVSGISGATAISAGTSHTCATLGDGTGRCWGYNYYGQLGDNTTTQRLMPTPVTGLSGAVGVGAQWLATCFAVTGGGVKCAGYNTTGGLGDGSTAHKTAVVSTGGLP
jgi:alpha-tubulin suppressor-like RCC1 family protein